MPDAEMLRSLLEGDNDLNSNTSNEASSSLVKVTTLIAVVISAVMVAAGVYGEATRRRGQVVRPVVQPTVITTGYFDPCNADHWGYEFPIKEKMQFRKQCEEHRIQ
jgi:hypothetical protein